MSSLALRGVTIKLVPIPKGTICGECIGNSSEGQFDCYELNGASEAKCFDELPNGQCHIFVKEEEHEPV